jgi:hypothetical protein
VSIDFLYGYEALILIKQQRQRRIGVQRYFGWILTPKRRGVK